MITRRVPARRLLGIHPAIILAVLDVIGLLVAGYLSAVELAGGLPTCGLINGCEEVARSEYSRVGGVPVALLGVLFSVALLTLAMVWWRNNVYGLLLGHYGLSLLGVITNCYFLYLQVFVIKAFCIWCVTYEIAVLLSFLMSFFVWYRLPRSEVD